MASDDVDSGLFSINLSDSEDGDANSGSGSGAVRDRKGQTDAEFQAVKAFYRPKVENGEIWRRIVLPLCGRRVPKQEAQELLHAVEELYFGRQWDEAVAFVGRVLEGEGGADGLDSDVRDALKVYEGKCREKMGRS